MYIGYCECVNHRILLEHFFFFLEIINLRVTLWLDLRVMFLVIFVFPHARVVVFIYHHGLIVKRWPWIVALWRWKFAFCLNPFSQMLQMYCGGLPHSSWRWRFKLPLFLYERPHLRHGNCASWVPKARACLSDDCKRILWRAPVTETVKDTRLYDGTSTSTMRTV